MAPRANTSANDGGGYGRPSADGAPAMKVAGYARVSTTDQAEEGFSLEVQEQRMRDAVAARRDPRCECVEVYVDPGVSGRSADKRPQLQRMLADAEAGAYDVVMIPALDRLGRNARDLYEIMQRLERAGVALVSLRGDVDTTTATGKLITGMMATVAEFESNLIGERTRGGKAKAASKGRPNGGKRRVRVRPGLGGYRLTLVIPRADEVAVVERIFREVANGVSQKRGLRNVLNADGYRTAYGHRWSQAQVSQLIRDPVWAGKIRSKHSEQGCVDVAGDLGELIPRDLREKVQARLAPKGEPGRGRPSAHFLLGNGLLHCGRCGAAMRVCRDLKGYGWYETYRCYGSR